MITLKDNNDLCYYKSLKPKKKMGFTKFQFTCCDCGCSTIRNLASITFPFRCVSCAKKQLYKERPEILEKIKKTFIEHYGAMGFASTVGQKALAEMKERNGGLGFASSTATEKYKNTMKEKYGVEYPTQSKELKKTIENTLQKRYGCTHPMQNKKLVEKSKETYTKHYGAVGFASSEIREKYNKTCIEKYGNGVDASKTDEANRKNRKKYFYDNRVFDSSWELAFYVYLSDKQIPFQYHPKIEFTYFTKDGNEHRYHPDFLVGKRYIEIKGRHLINENGELIDPFHNVVDIEKTECLKRNKILIMTKCNIFVKFVKNKYGNKFIKNCRIGNKKDEY